jgi:hypothetical protein
MIVEHEMISITAKRACYQCGRKMKFEEMVEANKDKPIDHLRMIWEDPLFELYCCGCFNREMFPERFIKYHIQQNRFAPRFPERYSLEDLLNRRRERDRPDSFFSEYCLEPSSDDENEL